jgi:DNA-binding PadR family transcriptional regulator
MLLTQKQIALIQVIAMGNSDGTHADLDQVIERCGYNPSKQSIQFSIRALVEKGLVERGSKERRRGRMRVTIIPTHMGKHYAGPLSPRKGTMRGVVSTVEEEDFLDSLK